MTAPCVGRHLHAEHGRCDRSLAQWRVQQDAVRCLETQVEPGEQGAEHPLAPPRPPKSSFLIGCCQKMNRNLRPGKQEEEQGVSFLGSAWQIDGKTPL